MTRQRSRLRLFSATLCGVAIVATLTACTDGSTEAGMGLPTLSGTDASSVLNDSEGETDARRGTLNVLENGCFVWSQDDGAADGAWSIWPEGYSRDADTVVFADGTRVTDGDALLGFGGFVPLESLPGGDEGSSYFGSFGGFCGADRAGALVLVEVTLTSTG